MFFNSSPHGGPVGLHHHLHDPNIYFQSREACWPACCPWVVKEDPKMPLPAPATKVFSSCLCPGLWHLVMVLQDHIMRHVEGSSTLSRLLHRTCGLQGTPVRKRVFCLQVCPSAYVIFFFALASITSIWAELSSGCNNIAPPNTWEDLIWHFELRRACQSHQEACFLLARIGDCAVGNCYAQLTS